MSVNTISRAADKFLFFHNRMSATAIQINLNVNKNGKFSLASFDPVSSFPTTKDLAVHCYLFLHRV